LTRFGLNKRDRRARECRDSAPDAPTYALTVRRQVGIHDRPALAGLGRRGDTRAGGGAAGLSRRSRARGAAGLPGGARAWCLSGAVGGSARLASTRSRRAWREPDVIVSGAAPAPQRPFVPSRAPVTSPGGTPSRTRRVGSGARRRREPGGTRG